MSTRKQTFSQAASDNHDCVLVSEQRYSWPVLVDLHRIITTWPFASIPEILSSFSVWFLLLFILAPSACELVHFMLPDSFEITNYAPHIHQLRQKYDHISLMGHYMCVFFLSFEKHNAFGMKSFNALH